MPPLSPEYEAMRLRWEARRGLCIRCDEPRVAAHYLCATHAEVEAQRVAEMERKLELEQTFREQHAERMARRSEAMTPAERYDAREEFWERAEDARQARLARNESSREAVEWADGEYTDDVSPDDRRDR
jgi:hypothetical protein